MLSVHFSDITIGRRLIFNSVKLVLSLGNLQHRHCDLTCLMRYSSLLFLHRVLYTVCSYDTDDVIIQTELRCRLESCFFIELTD